MDNIIEGRIIQKLAVESGESARGKWEKQNFIVETVDSQYPRKICIGLWTNQIPILQNYQIGDMIRAFINIESREFNGRWYTDIRAWKLENPAAAPMPQQQGMPYGQMGMPYGQPMQQPMGAQMPQYQQPQQPQFEAPNTNLPGDITSDLPF